MTKKRLVSTVAALIALLYIMTLTVSFYLIRNDDILSFDVFFQDMNSARLNLKTNAEYLSSDPDGFYHFQQMLKTTFTSNEYPSLYVLMDEDGNILDQRSSTLYGSLQGKEHCFDIQSYITDDNRTELLRDFSNPFSSNTTIQTVSYHETTDGEFIPVSLTYTTDNFAHGKPNDADALHEITFNSYPVTITAQQDGYCFLFVHDINIHSYEHKCYTKLYESFENTLKEIHDDYGQPGQSFYDRQVENYSTQSFSYPGNYDNYKNYFSFFTFDNQQYLLYIGTLRSDLYTLLYSDYILPVFLVITGLFIIFGLGLIFAVIKLFNKNKKLNETRIAFISGAAHELKTPLAVISNQCECLLENVAPEKNTYYISSIYGEVGRMNNSVVRLLQYSRLSAASKLVKSDCCISEIIADEAERHRSLAQSKSLLISTDIEADIRCICSGDLIALAVGNYLSNGIKYATPDGEVRVSLKLTGDTATLSVYNDGALIDDSESKNIWEVLYKSDKARTADGSSTGIGLPTNKLIFDLHKYKYGFKNMNNGVCFWFDIKGAEKK